MEFQIQQNFGVRGEGYLYFDMPDEATHEEIKREAIRIQKDDWERRVRCSSYWFGPPKERPTIHIREYNDGVVRGGLKLKTKWR